MAEEEYKRDSAKWKRKYEKVKQYKETIEKELTEKKVEYQKAVQEEKKKEMLGQVDDNNQFMGGGLMTPRDQKTQQLINILLEKQRKIAPPGTRPTDDRLLSNPIARADRIQQERTQWNRFDTWNQKDAILYNSFAAKPEYMNLLNSSDKTMIMFPEYFGTKIKNQKIRNQWKTAMFNAAKFVGSLALQGLRFGISDDLKKKWLEELNNKISGFNIDEGWKETLKSNMNNFAERYLGVVQDLRSQADAKLNEIQNLSQMLGNKDISVDIISKRFENIFNQRDKAEKNQWTKEDNTFLYNYLTEGVKEKEKVKESIWSKINPMNLFSFKDKDGNIKEAARVLEVGDNEKYQTMDKIADMYRGEIKDLTIDQQMNFLEEKYCSHLFLIMKSISYS